MKVYMTKVFMNGGSQAIRIPAELRFEEPEVFIYKDEVTRNVVLSSRAPSVWDNFFRKVEEFRSQPDDGSGEQFTKTLRLIRDELNSGSTRILFDEDPK